MSENGTALATRDTASLLEQVIIKGDLRNLTPAQKVDYYNRVCESVGVNPLTQPFAYITLNGREVLYATRNCTDQLRNNRHIDAHIVSRERMDDVYVVTARVTLPDGRSDESIGAVAIGIAKGDALANALMKCETKAKRRATLSLVGLSLLDETEVETIPGARIEPMPTESVRVIEPQPAQRLDNPAPVSPQPEGRSVASRTVEQPECADCHKPITGHKFSNGAFWNPQTVRERTSGKFGRDLCFDCAEKAAAAEAVAESGQLPLAN